MAGSMKWFVYTTDAGQTYAIYRDESNLELVNTGGDYGTGSTETDALPRNITPRYARYRSTDGTVSRNIVALTTAALTAAPATITDAVSGLTLNLQGRNGERKRLPIAADTGLTDSDAT